MGIATMNSQDALIVALGGGGDIIAAYLLGDLLAKRGLRPVFASLAWERFVKDPQPGPRRPGELTGVELVDRSLGKSSAACSFTSGARTNQGFLSANLGMSENYLLDAWGGVRSLTEGLAILDRMFAFTEVWGIDVGGDVLANCPSPMLSSPLADAMMLAALASVYPSAFIAVVAPGLDGEMPQTLCDQLIRSHYRSGMIVDWRIFDRRAIDLVATLFDRRELDSDVTAAVVRSYQGLSGRLLMRRAGVIVNMGLSCLPIAVYRASDMHARVNALSPHLLPTESLDEASQVVTSLGYQSELEHERRVFSANPDLYRDMDARVVAPQLLAAIRKVMAERQVQFATERFFADSLKFTIGSVRSALDLLVAENAIEVARPFITTVSTASP